MLELSNQREGMAGRTGTARGHDQLIPPSDPRPLTSAGTNSFSFSPILGSELAARPGWIRSRRYVGFAHDHRFTRPAIDAVGPSFRDAPVTVADSTLERPAEELVVLVDPDGRPIGRQAKADVHSRRTPLHLAFSLYLFNDAGEVLMTRRALTKKTWPGVWTNTCCGHPAPGESPAEAARRRLADELGLQALDYRCVLPDFAYFAEDATGIQENELCPVFTARVHPDAVVRMNPAEVLDQSWISWTAVRSSIVQTPFAFSPWAVGQVEQLRRLEQESGSIVPTA